MGDKHQYTDPDIEQAKSQATVGDLPVPTDLDTTLPDRDDEGALRSGERMLAERLVTLSKDAASALRKHDRVAAAMVLAQIAQVCAHGHKAEVAAINKAMEAHSAGQ